LQIEIPESPHLDKREFVTISAEYGNGDSVEFEWEFVPDTSPSILLVSPPSQFTYGGRSTTLALTNSRFDMRNPPLIHVGASLAPPVRIETASQDVTVVHFIAPAVTGGCELGASSCYVTANVTHSSYEVALLFRVRVVVPMQPKVESLTQYTGSSFGGDYLAATILDLPPVADGDVSLVTIQFGATFVAASAVYNNADGSLSISFRTPPLTTTRAGGIVTVQFTRADIPQLSARVEFQVIFHLFLFSPVFFSPFMCFHPSITTRPQCGFFVHRRLALDPARAERKPICPLPILPCCQISK
jgi:hypothetical protein